MLQDYLHEPRCKQQGGYHELFRQKVHTINLSNNKITRFSKLTFSNMENLRRLALNHNNLKNIDRPVFQMLRIGSKYLEFLALGQNDQNFITDFGVLSFESN